jgi:hypothetical protein
VEDAVPAPRSRTLLTAVLAALVLAAAACGGGDGGGGGASQSAAPVQDKVTVTPETVATPFTLAEGIYRVNWVSECTKITLVLTGDTGFSKEKTSTLPKFSWLVTGVPAGTYTLGQTEATCTGWTVIVEKIG